MWVLDKAKPTAKEIKTMAGVRDKDERELARIQHEETF